MIIQERDSARIRKNALHMARKKAEQGCLPCVKGYLELAKQHAATQEELLLAMENVSTASDKEVNRRDLLKLVLGVAAGLIVSLPEILRSETAWADERGFWGTDSTTATCCAIPQDFYIGHLGSGTATGDTGDFNTDAAKKASSHNTYGYWNVSGPDQASGSDFYAWGLQQGRTAVGEWTNNPNASLVEGKTIFADVRRENPGWGNDQIRNQSVLQGFLDGIQNGKYTPGVYVSPNVWQAFFGAGYAPKQSFVLWMTGCQTCVVDCSPCDNSCQTTLAQVRSLLPTVSHNFLGKSQAVLWQYWIGSCQCGYYNVAVQNPSGGFTPVVGPTYQCTGCGPGTGNCK
jgi:hypothetical protein